jgi:mycothiol synthase
MNIRQFKDDDLGRVVRLLDENCAYDSMTAPVLKEKIFDDPEYDPASVLVSEENGAIIGFMQGVMRLIRGETIGYIKLMAVSEAMRRRGIAREMYVQLENHFREKKAEKVRIYDVPFNYFMPGIDPRYTPAVCFALRLGFVRFADTSNLRVALQTQDWSTKKEEERLKIKDKRIEIKRVGEEDREGLMELIDAEFPLWRAEVTASFKSSPVAVHIALLDGKVKAFSGHNGNNVGTGWFGPMGTHPDLRGKGIGGILYKRCLADMQAWGLEYGIIPWVGPIDFYAHYSNAVVERVFWRYEKML